MMKLLIAERDYNERVAIQWLISTYSLRIEEVLTASSPEEIMILLEKEKPDIFYVELDMIPYEQWKVLSDYVKTYSKKVIAVTAEATFERAKQAIEWRSVDLLVKPLDPVKIKNGIRMALSLVEAGEVDIQPAINNIENISYKSLFIKEESRKGVEVLMLFHIEDNAKLPEMNKFLKDFPFREEPTILPLTDASVCLFLTAFADIKEEANIILREWEASHVSPLAVVLVPNESGKKSIYDMYQLAKRLLEVTFFVGYRQVILPKEEYKYWEDIDPFLTPKEQREWINMLNQFDKNAIKQWMHHEFLKMQIPFPNPEMLRTRLTSILAQIRRFMKTYRLDQKEIENKYREIFVKILFNGVLYRIVQEMLLFIYELLDKAEKSEGLAKKDVIEKGISYIESHYTDPNLSLEKVAKFVGRSTAYYSHLLMKNQGISFRQLLVNIRIREAKKLLTATQLSIKEIAHEVGFNNPTYFTRIFKARTKMSPREYRTYKKG